MYYDKKALPIYVYNYNDYLKTTETVKSDLDFVGKLLETTSTHSKGTAIISTKDSYYYDYAGRLLKQKQQINSQTEEVIAQNYYDDLGQLIGKGIGGTTLQTSLQTIDYTYNIRGWLKGINDVNNLGSDLFSFKLNYDTAEIGSTNALQYNGNISETIWRTANDVSDNKTRAYAYQYDALSRITGADYGIKTTTSFNLASGFDMGVGLYDKNGNIKSLWRDNMSNVKIDNLTYTYANGDASNKLLNVEDSSGSPEGFKNGATLATEYTYDGNGNLKEDKNKGITNIIYNHLNLPSQITFATGKIEYFYDANGTKQKKKVTDGTVITTTDYAGKSIYRNNALQFISQPEGYLELDGQGGYDYGARFYAASLGRFHTIDPLAEKFPWQSTYVYADNDPIRFVDYMGMSAEEPDNWITGSLFRLLSGSSGEIDAPKEVDISNQTRQVTKAVKTVEDGAEVMEGAGDLMVEAIPSALQTSATALEVLSYTAAIPTEGGSLLLLPVARVLGSVGVLAEAVKDGIEGNYGDAITKIGVHIAFGTTSKSIQKTAHIEHWDTVSEGVVNLVNDVAAHIGSFIRNETSTKVKEKKSK